MNGKDLIDSGWQFRVYDRGIHVEKVPKGRFRALASILSSRPLLVSRPLKLKHKLDRLINDRKEGLRKVESGFFPDELVADSKIENGNLVQKKVTMVKNAIEEADAERGRELIDMYIEHVKQSWKYGFSESSFNFTINHGIDEEDRMVLVDIGEANYSKSEVREQIENQKWLEQSIYKDFLPQNLQKYFKNKMNEELTAAKLEENWKENI
ncbi:MAG: hypothetical protein BRC30_00660 [Nanohaloarchaea archaeon SW_7_46_7]|nr:MAG: hypothetical protein BRC30_00660 [Nanohaloarchaea archaeon SW_7_46_7]